jgi:hypothetical protein
VTRVDIRRQGVAGMLALAALAGTGTVAAETVCPGTTDADRARCELERRAAQACAGRSGADPDLCRNLMLSPPPREDCGRLAEGYGRNKCEDRNLKRDLEDRCGGKSCEEYSRCYGEVMAKALKR